MDHHVNGLKRQIAAEDLKVSGDCGSAQLTLTSLDSEQECSKIRS
jgi:hypothetical protein